MACGLSKSLSLSSSLKKQGIVTILSGDCDFDISLNTSAASLRRTLSADMSSKNWISGNGSCPMKRISSSEELRTSVTGSSSSSDEEGGGGEEEEPRSGFDIWAQIQEEKNKKNSSQTDVWSSILSQKTDSSKPLPPPYVHPLVKRSSSSLSEKSLQICTESLGSETGSDGFSSYQSSETGDAEEEREKSNQEELQKEVEAKEEQPEAEQESRVTKYKSNSTSCRKLPRGTFPPPIPSLSSQSGKSLQMRTRRNDGRLVLAAVSVPSQNNFCATRHDGRLVLTFAETRIDPKYEMHQDERKLELSWFEEESEEEIDEEEEDEDEEEEMAVEMEQEEQKLPNGLERGYGLAQKPNGLLSVHRLAHKPIGLHNPNPKWPIDVEAKNEFELSQSLPPRPRVARLARAAEPPSTVDDTAGAACFNTYDYYWRPTEPTIGNKALSPNSEAQFQAQNLHNKRGGGNDGWLSGCKEQRKSILFFEPFCIATS